MRSRPHAGKQEIWFHLQVHQARPAVEFGAASVCCPIPSVFLLWRCHLHVWAAGVKFLVFPARGWQYQLGKMEPAGGLCHLEETFAVLGIVCLDVFSFLTFWTHRKYVCVWYWRQEVSFLCGSPPECILAHSNAQADGDLLSQPFGNPSGNRGVVPVRVEQ